MSEILEYKCPACGGAMEFDSKSQKMKCPYCDTEVDIAEFRKQDEELNEKAQQDGAGKGAGQESAGQENAKADGGKFQNAGNAAWQEDETKGMKVYVCVSCGGEIIADETTGASTCPFCGNRVVVKEQFADTLKPDLIIPFQLNKKEAKERYRKHLEGKRFLPKVFRTENHIDEIKGLYVPFWIFDADVAASGSYSAQIVRTWRAGDTQYTETQFYQLERAGRISFADIPTDASKKMDDTLMESVEPYDAKKAVPFETAYLAGYLADRYDVEMEERFQRAAERIKATAEETLRSTVGAYQLVTTTGSHVDIDKVKYKYAMYPVWILNTTWRGERYLFAMNGQTGKMVGDLPVDRGAFWKFVLLCWIPCSVAAFLLLVLVFMIL